MFAVLLLAGCEPREDGEVGVTGEMLVGDHWACLLRGGEVECQMLEDWTDFGAVSSTPESRFESLVHGWSYLCGFTEEGVPVCWGENVDGAADIPDGLDVTTFFPGYANTCVLGGDGTLACWGNEWYGLNQPPEGHFAQVAMSENAACARSEDGAWSCWGVMWGVEESEDGDTFEWTLPEVPLVKLTGGAANQCGLDEDGGIHCWGKSTYGVTQPPEGTGYRDLSVGGDHACAIDGEDEVRCWGNISRWRVEPSGKWHTFDAGAWVDCGIREGGEIDCWGCLTTDPFTCDWDGE